MSWSVAVDRRGPIQLVAKDEHGSRWIVARAGIGMEELVATGQREVGETCRREPD